MQSHRPRRGRSYQPRATPWGQGNALGPGRHRSPAPEGPIIPAQGNALGPGRHRSPAPEGPIIPAQGNALGSDPETRVTSLEQSEVLAVPFLFELVLGHEAQGRRVHAVALASGRGAVVEDVAKVAVARAAAHLGAG